MLCSCELNGALTALNNIRSFNGSTFTGGAANYAPYTLAAFAASGLLNTGQSQQNALLREILTEKYLSLIGQVEPFHDLRRTGNLIGVPKKRVDTPSIPQRYLSCANEVSANPNVPNPLPPLYEPTEVNC